MAPPTLPKGEIDGSITIEISSMINRDTLPVKIPPKDIPQGDRGSFSAPKPGLKWV